MGNSPSELVTCAAEQSDERLESLSKEDLKVLNNPWFVLNSMEFMARSDLKYEIPGDELSLKKEEITTTQEESMMCSLQNPKRFREKHEDACKSLLSEILQQRGDDKEHKENITRLQAYVRVFDALIRNQERSVRLSKKEAAENVQQTGFNNISKAAVIFGLNSMLNLVKCVGGQNPSIFKRLISQTSELLANTYPCSIANPDPVYIEALTKVSSFFQSVLKGDFQNVSEENRLNSLSPLFAIGLSSGNLSSLLSIILQFIGNKTTPQFANTLQLLHSHFKILQTVPASVSYLSFGKIGSNINLGKNSTLAEHRTGNFASAFSEQEFTAGIHYFEFRIDKFGSIMISVADSEFSSSNCDIPAATNYFGFQANGNIYTKGSSLYTWEAWKVGDRIGVELNMIKRTVTFYKNGKIEPKPIHENVAEKVKLVLTMNEACKVEIVNFPELPLSIRKQLFEEELKTQPRIVYSGSETEYLSLTSVGFAGLVMKELIRLNESIKDLLKNLYAINIPIKLGVSFHIHESTLTLMAEIIEKLLDLVYSKQFEEASEESLSEFLVNSLKLLKIHLLGSITQKQLVISKELKNRLMSILEKISANPPSQGAIDESNEILGCCFEVFYTSPTDKLSFLLGTLREIKSGKEVPSNIKALRDKIFTEMASPLKLFPALSVKDENQFVEVIELFDLLLDLSFKDSLSIIEGKIEASGLIKFLEIGQLVLFAQAATDNYQGKWQEVLSHYSVKFTSNTESIIRTVQALLKDSKVPETLAIRIEQTIAGKAIICLLNILILNKMNLDFLSKLLPALNSLIATVALFPQQQGKLAGGITTVNDVYESSHNYADNLNITHLIQVPFCKKYTLRFDSQCKTENGCDYLELWLDENKDNKFARWEGDNFPKDPVIVENQLLYFTFHSDGSVNYWGWKIEIEALVETEFMQHAWPETIKESCGLVIGSISRKLISGEFDSEVEDENIVKILENPLLMYGIQDKYLTIVKTPEPLNESLRNISTTAGIVEKFKPVMLIRAYSEDVNRRVIRSQDLARNLGDYVEEYGYWGEPRFTDDNFLQVLVEGTEDLQKTWELVKRKAQVIGPESVIGGKDMDQAERAIFAVYVGYFGISGTVKKLLEHPVDISPTLKFIIKTSSQIRLWAQRFKQKSYDGDNKDISYKQISDIVVKKCCFLLAAEYKMSLNEIGITKVLKSLSSTVQSYNPANKKDGSKWKSVSNLVESSKKLKGLVNISKSDNSTLSDQEELNRIIELVNSFLESPTAIEKIVEAIEKRRSKAIARTLGFLCLANLLNFSAKHETWLVRAFSTALKVKGKKEHYWKGLEGSDPILLGCLQKAFFQVYGLLQKELIRSRAKPFTVVSYSHYISVIEAMSCPLRGVDAHMILELQFPSTLHILFSWAKGYLGEEVISRPFLKGNCITEFSLVSGASSENRLLLESFEDQPSLFIQFEKGGSSLPVSDFLIIPAEGCDIEAALEFNIKGVAHKLLIKRENPASKGSYLTSFDGLNPIMTKYEDLLGEEKANDKVKREELKLRLSKSAWALYKLIMYSIVGAWAEYNEQKKTLVQELFVRILFTELKWEDSSNKPDEKDLNISEACSGELWLGKMIVPKSLQKNPMIEWMRMFSKEIEGLGDLMIKGVISEYVEKVDPAMKGILNEVDIGYIDQESALKLKEFEDNKNSKGQYDFFKYLNGLKRLIYDFPFDVQDYVEASPLWRDVPEDFYEASKDFNFLSIERIVQNCKKLLLQADENSFIQYLEAFITSEISGIADKVTETDPPEFKNSSGKLDFYHTIHAIFKNQEKFQGYYTELERFYFMYDDLPATCEEIYKERLSQEDYITSLLWTLFGCLGSECLGKVLSRPQYLEELLKITFLSKSEKTVTLGFRILAQILPAHHSPQSLIHTWTSISKSFKIPERVKMIPYLLKKIGRGYFSFASKDKIKIQMRWLYESQNLLLALSRKVRWNSEISTTLVDLISEGIELIVNGKQLESHHMGAVLFLGSISKHSDSFDLDPIELSVVALQDSTLASAVVKKINGTDAVLYSVIEDSSVTEPLTKISGVNPYVNNDFYATLTAQYSEKLAEILLKFWSTLQNNKEFTSCKDSVASIRIVYQKLSTAAIVAYTSIIEHITLSTEQTAEIMCTISNTYKETEVPSKPIYNKVVSLVSANTRSENHSEKVAEMTEEEAYQKLAQLKEEEQIIASELLSLDVPVTRVIKCFDKGIKDVEGVLSYIEPVVEEKQAEYFYQLSSISALKVVDPSGQAEIYQDSMSHLVIRNKGDDDTRKEVVGSFSKNVFRSLKQLPESLTIVTAIEGKVNKEGKLTYGLKIGEMVYELSNRSGNGTISLTGNQFTIDKLVVLRIFVNPMGEVLIINEVNGESFKTFFSSVYNGLTIGDFGLYLEEGSSAELLLFDIHIGKYTVKIDKSFDRPKLLDGGERFLKIKSKSKNTEKSRLRLLGFNDAQITESAKHSLNFEGRIKYCLDHFENENIESAQIEVNHDIIVDVMVVDNKEAIPKGYKTLPVLESGKFIEFTAPGQRLIVIKKEEYKAGKYCTGFSVLEAVDDHANIGELSLNLEGDHPDWSTPVFAKLVVPKLGENPIRDILIYKTSTTNSIILPFGYSFIVDKEQKAINIAPKTEKSFYLFVALLREDTLMDSYVTPYSTVKVSVGSLGMVDKFDASNQKKLDSTKEFEDMSPVELHITLFEFENARGQESVRRLFTSLAKKSEKVFMQILEDGNVNTILSILKTSLKELSHTFDSLFRANEGIKVREKVVCEIIRGLVSAIVAEEGGGTKSLRPLTIESVHPYDNNMNFDQVISIPGASGLRIVFDPQCHTESGCDPLRFYESAGRNGEIRNISGSGETVWTPFEVQSDTVHMAFNSDGSVVYWGYKFEVTPISGSKVIEESPEVTLWLLQRIMNIDELSQEFKILLSPRVLKAIFILSLSSSKIEHKQVCIEIIRKFLRGQQHDEINKILNAFIKEATVIYEKNKKNPHPILQSLIHLIAGLDRSYNLKLSEEWLINFSELLSDMKGLCDKGENLEYFLFERFKAKLSKSFSSVHESEHPYKRQTATHCISAPLASFISIEFDEKSVLDPRDEILFSYDQSLQRICQSNSKSMGSVTGVGWDNITKGPDISITNEGLIVTRTNSSSWGGAQWTESYSTGITRIAFHIDNDGSSDYLYIGFAEVSDFPTLNSCINADLAKNLWTWKRSGEAHRKGSNVPTRNYKTGDTICFLLDMNKKELSFIIDDQEVHKFTGLCEEVRPIISFGGTGQVVSLLSVEKSGGASEINKRSLKIPGDTIYCSFPVNIGATKNHLWKTNIAVASCDAQSKVITKLQPEKSIHCTNEVLVTGKNLIELTVSSAGKMSLGFALTTSAESKDLDNFYSMLYNSEGSVTFHREEVKTEEFTIGDVIGCYFDFESHSVRFYKNGANVFEGVVGPFEETNSLNFVAVLFDEKQSLTINSEFKQSIDIDLIKTADPAATNCWGYKFTATYEFKGRGTEMMNSLLSTVNEELKKEWLEEYLPKFSSYFKTGAAEQLVMYLDEFIANKPEKKVLELTEEDIKPTPEELIYYPDLEKLSILEIRELYQILLVFNTEVNKDMNLINLHIEGYENMSELQRVFMGSRNYIFFSSKYALFKEVITKSNNDARPEIQVDRPKAMRHRQRKDVDSAGQFSILGQIFRAINNKTNNEFRNSERIFRVNYRGEAATDAGGPYNEVISNMCDELQSSFLTLLIPTPNNSHNMGENRDCWIVNPSATSPIEYEMFLFLGKLMGVAIRTQNNLNLSLPPLFWKRLLLDQVNVKDLRSIDVCLVQILEILSNPEANKITPEIFNDSYDEKFTAKDTSGKEVELKENGKNIQVTYENAKEYSELVEKMRLGEAQKAYEMIRKGMSAVIPMDYLNLLSWRQVQTLVCGAPDINIDILKERTSYECAENAPHIGFFWEVLREMNTKEKSLYLKFVWGRSRLPAGKDFRKMKIAGFHSAGNVNNYLPVSHTCFFTIDLPSYTTKEAMRSKLLYAITHCTAIDLDGTASGGWDDND